MPTSPLPSGTSPASPGISPASGDSLISPQAPPALAQGVTLCLLVNQGLDTAMIFPHRLFGAAYCRVKGLHAYLSCDALYLPGVEIAMIIS